MIGEHVMPRVVKTATITSTATPAVLPPQKKLAPVQVPPPAKTSKQRQLGDGVLPPEF
jgi:hypothetical protein